MKEFKTINRTHSWEISLETYPGAKDLNEVINFLNNGGFCYRLIVNNKQTQYHIDGTTEKLLVPTKARCLISLRTGKILANRGELVRILVYKNTTLFTPVKYKQLRWANM